MITITGTLSRTGNYRMHSPKFPYNSTTYIGYTEKEMKAKYRKDNHLEHKHIEWIILK